MTISKAIRQTIRAALEDTQTRIDHSQAVMTEMQRDEATQEILDARNWLYELPDTPTIQLSQELQEAIMTCILSIKHSYDSGGRLLMPFESVDAADKLQIWLENIEKENK